MNELKPLPLRKWQIRRKSNIGQRLITVYDLSTNNFVQEVAYAEPNFEMSAIDAHVLFLKLKANSRCRWIHLYEVIG